MTPSQREELARLLAEGTGGEWRACRDWVDTGTMTVNHIPHCSPEDARLIAAMHSALPQLLADSEELERVKGQQHATTGHTEDLFLDGWRVTWDPEETCAFVYERDNWRASYTDWDAGLGDAWGHDYWQSKAKLGLPHSVYLAASSVYARRILEAK